MGLYCSIVVRSPGKKQSPCRHMNFVPHRKRLNKKVKEKKRKGLSPHAIIEMESLSFSFL